MMEYLTGRRRYRKLFNPTFDNQGNNAQDLLILQVEVSRFKQQNWISGGRWVCSFRDAVADDITKAEEIV